MTIDNYNYEVSHSASDVGEMCFMCEKVMVSAGLVFSFRELPAGEEEKYEVCSQNCYRNLNRFLLYQSFDSSLSQKRNWPQKRERERLINLEKNHNILLSKMSSCQSEVEKLKNSDTEQRTQINQNQGKIKRLETRTTNLEQNLQIIWKKVFPLRVSQTNIYDFDTYYHWIGWYFFLVFSGYIARKVYRIKTKKRKESKNYLAEIRRIFKEWQLNMYASTGAYVAGFFLIQQAIAKWINPRISGWLITQKAITISVVCLIIGGGFYLDGIITSSLKTPLQRLGIRIENANIDEKVKKSLLSKTQQVSELFKETLKRFGLLAVVGLLTKLIEAFWNKDILSYLSYAVPIAGAIKIIWDVDKTLKKIELTGSKKI